MIHRMTFQSNPRLMIVALLIVGLPVAGIWATIYWADRGGILGLALAGYLVYHLVKFIIPQISSRLETSETGLTCSLSGREPLVFRWEDVTFAGLCQRKGERPTIFLYDRQNDHMLSIPNEFSHFNALMQTVRDHTSASYQEINLEKAESLKDWLRKQLEHDLPNPQTGEDQIKKDADPPVSVL